MSRHHLAIALALALLTGGGVAEAQTSAAEKADKLNNEGQALFSKGQYEPAVQKFREAILFSAEGRFYFNLCYTLNKMSKYRDAITACEAVRANGASKPLQEKTDKLLEALRAHVANTSEDPTLDPGDPNTGDPNTGDPNTGDPNTGDPNTGDPNTGDPNTGDPNNGGTPGDLPPPPAAGGVVEQKAPPPIGAYKWALGGELGLLRSTFGRSGSYDPSAAGLNLHADFVLSEARKVGVQGYLGFTNVTAGDFDALSVIDVGGALFIHRPLGERLAVTGLGGVHLGLLQPQEFNGGSAAATLGARVQGAFSYLAGARGQHAFTLALILNLYGPAGETADFDPADFGLDKAATTVGVQFGYTHRFATPFGSTPVFTLE